MLLIGARAAAQQDTIRMQVTTGPDRLATFSFEADTVFSYRIDWGEAGYREAEGVYTTPGKEEEVTYPYDNEGTYDIVFYRVKEEPIEIEMVWVDGGTLTIGCTDDRLIDDPYEPYPQSVTLEGYYISKYEITQAQWEAVMKTKPSKFKGDNRPVESVSWDKAEAFCKMLSERNGKTYKLPTEAQWEFAARGGTKSKGYMYSGGNTVQELKNVAWCYYNKRDDQTHEVGTKSPNELGIYDMTGNVWEWCDGTIHGGDYRVCRGGSFYNTEVSCRVWYREGAYTRTYADVNIGFRIVCIP